MSLVMGHLRYRERGSVVDCNLSSQTGLGIPSSVDNISDICADAEYILVVEKESAFLRLANDHFCQENRAIVLTGKGYPDVSTRLFLHKLAKDLGIPVFGLSDGDPHGVDIMSTYRFGSLQMAHDAKNLSTARLQWIGVFPRDREEFGIPKRCCLALSKRDYAKGAALLKKPFFQNLAPDWCLQLEAMLESGWKLEIEALAAVSLDLLSHRYIRQKIVDLKWSS